MANHYINPNTYLTNENVYNDDDDNELENKKTQNTVLCNISITSHSINAIHSLFKNNPRLTTSDGITYNEINAYEDRNEGESCQLLMGK